MASRAVQFDNSFVKNLLAQEIEGTLFMFTRRCKKDIRIHLDNIKSFLSMFEMEEEYKVRLFRRYFEPEILFEIESRSDFNETNNNVKWYSDTLTEMFPIKESRARKAKILLLTRQQEDEGIQDFGRRVRRAAKDFTEDKERIELAIFKRGIRSETMREAVKLLKPKTLEEAVSLIKEEDEQKETGRISHVRGYEEGRMNDESEGNRVRHMRVDKNATLEIQKLKEEVRRLQAIINAKVEEKNAVRKEYGRDAREIVCFNCDRKGHIARDCDQEKKWKCYNCNKIGHRANECPEKASSMTCYGCNKKGHLIKDCRYQKGESKKLEDKRRDYRRDDFKRVRQLEEISVAAYDSDSSTSSYSERGIKSITKQENKKKVHKRKTLEEKWADYIEGSTAKPKKTLRGIAQTLISQRRSEKAANKPIICCKIQGQEVKALFDTGADLNVVSSEFAKILMEKNPEIIIKDSKTRVAYADGSKGRSQGWIKLRMDLGAQTTTHKFEIMEDIFPHVYIGLRCMKEIKLTMIPAEDCIEIMGVKIPFLSKTKEPSSLNCNRPLLCVRERAD